MLVFCGSLLMVAISTDLMSETESFKIEYFKCFLWNWVEKQQGVISHQYFSCTPPLFCMSSCADLVLLLSPRNLNRVCVSGEDRGELAHGAVINEA